MCICGFPDGRSAASVCRYALRRRAADALHRQDLMAFLRILLMDEPFMGLYPPLVQEIFKVIGKLQRTGTTILPEEKNARMVLSAADRGHVPGMGRSAMEDNAKELLEDDRMRKAYLGA